MSVTVTKKTSVKYRVLTQRIRCDAPADSVASADRPVVSDTMCAECDRFFSTCSDGDEMDLKIVWFCPGDFYVTCEHNIDVVLRQRAELIAADSDVAS